MIRIYTDEDVTDHLAVALRKRGYDAISVNDAETQGLSDVSQLAYAVNRGRAILTHNTHHFPSLHADWVQAGNVHFGIILSSQLPLGELLRRMLNLLDTLSADEIHGRLVWLNSYR